MRLPCERVHLGPLGLLYDPHRTRPLQASWQAWRGQAAPSRAFTFFVSGEIFGKYLEWLRRAVPEVSCVTLLLRRDGREARYGRVDARRGSARGGNTYRRSASARLLRHPVMAAEGAD